MPHLAPLKWSLIFLFPISLVLLTISLVWWQQTPRFPSLSSSKLISWHNWKW
uniref:ATP synthase F0 subunit 8 n=1 Tax=Synelmis amoureuxi TaxID=3053537 RepID=UPI0030DED5B8